MITPLQFATTHNPGRDGADGNLTLVNGYAEIRGADGKSNVVWYAAEGLADFATLPYGGPVQGLLEVDGTLYVVAARQIYSVTAAGDVTHLGGFPADGPVTMAANRKLPVQIGICAGGLLSVVDDGAVYATTPSIAGPDSLTVIDGFAVVGNNLGQIGVSALDDMRTWDPLDVASANAHRDGIARVFAFKGTLMLAGERSIEHWANTGASFPFAPIAGTANSLGTRSPATFVEVPIRQDDTAAFWVASDNTVRRAVGTSGQTVSSAEVERLIEATADKSQLMASTYVRPQHAFYVLSGPGWSRVYDATNDRWLARESYNNGGRWKVGPTARIGDAWVGGDVAAGKLYRIASDAYDEAGSHLVWTVRSMLSGYPNGIELPALWLDTIPGAGLNTTNEHNADPQVMIRVSRDMGKTWGPWRSYPVGKIGEHTRRVKTTRWGQSKEDGFLVEVQMSAAVVRGLTGGAAEVTAVAA